MRFVELFSEGFRSSKIVPVSRIEAIKWNDRKNGFRTAVVTIAGEPEGGVKWLLDEEAVHALLTERIAPAAPMQIGGEPVLWIERRSDAACAVIFDERHEMLRRIVIEEDQAALQSWPIDTEIEQAAERATKPQTAAAVG